MAFSQMINHPDYLAGSDALIAFFRLDKKVDVHFFIG